MEFHETMLRDHENLSRGLRDMLEAARAGDREALSREWDRFEVALLRHLNGEEMFLIPALERHDPARAAAILAEHQRVRAALAVIGIGLDLHTVRDTHIEELAARLEEHARAEEVDFYRWAEESAPEASSGLTRWLARLGSSIV